MFVDSGTKIYWRGAKLLYMKGDQRNDIRKRYAALTPAEKQDLKSELLGVDHGSKISVMLDFLLLEEFSNILRF